MGFLKSGHLRRNLGIVVLGIVMGGVYQNCAQSGGKAFVLGSASNTTTTGSTVNPGPSPSPAASPLPSPTPTNWKSISAGGETGCGVTPAGAAWCWGDDGYGQLGDGNSGLATFDCCGNQLTQEQFSTVHVQPRGLTSGVTSISTDGSSTCAVVNAGVQCWGAINGSTLPIPVSGLTSGVTAVSVGGFACAIVNGAAYCWGQAPYGLGNGSTSSNTPVLVSGMGSGVTAISVGAGIAACAIVNGGAKCWGFNSYGELGNGSTTNSPTPVQVTGLTAGVTSISQSGYSACLVVNGSAECWGYNYWGNLGNGVTNTTSPYGSPNPVQVSGLTSGVTSVSVGSATSTCAIVNGAGRCWGYNFDGELGNGTTTNSSVPTSVSGGTSGVTLLSTGGASTCAIINNAPKCWGSNVYGALGNGSQTSSSVPVSVQ